MTSPPRGTCWICGSSAVSLLRDGLSPRGLAPSDFAITDARYGMTLSLYRCGACGYVFCPEADDLLPYYEQLEDTAYEQTRPPRALQARAMVKVLKKHCPAGRLLDIGAGSGILVEEALAAGYDAHGVEPSGWLAEQAQKRRLPVRKGLFPDDAPAAPFDIITLVDVIEHVTRPLPLLQDMARHMRAEGIGLIVTPDAASLAARLTGRKWWHYRVAHVSYFTQRTLTLALEKAGLQPIAWHRPRWYFPLDYLLSRLWRYTGLSRPFTPPAFTKRVTVPLNLFDSWLVVVRKQ